jgi:hypothetical protein
MDIERMKKKIEIVMENYRPGAELVFVHSDNCREMTGKGACSCEPHILMAVPGGDK